MHAVSGRKTDEEMLETAERTRRARGGKVEPRDPVECKKRKAGRRVADNPAASPAMRCNHLHTYHWRFTTLTLFLVHVFVFRILDEQLVDVPNCPLLSKFLNTMVGVKVKRHKE